MQNYKTINDENVNYITALYPSDGRQSFYGKCNEYETDNYIYLESYDTLMCRLNKATGQLEKLDGYRSATTSRHLKSFFSNNNIPISVDKFYKMDTLPDESVTYDYEDFKKDYDSLSDTTKKHLANSNIHLTSMKQAQDVMKISKVFDVLFRLEESKE